MVVPDGDPGEEAVGEKEVCVGAVLGEAGAVVVESENFTAGIGGAWVAAWSAASGFINVVSEVDLWMIAS